MNLIRRWIFVGCVLVSVGFVRAADLLPFLPPWAAELNIGTNAIVYGKVGRVRETNGTIHLEVNHRSRNAFPALIGSGQTNLFRDLKQLVGKTIEVQGTIIEGKELPEILVTNNIQLKVVEGKVRMEEVMIRATALKYSFE